MPWVNLDENFPDHPKNDGLSDLAWRLHVSAICHCNRHLTDGLISAAKVPRLVPRFRMTAVTELVTKGHWYFHEAIDSYEIHDFLQWNRSREQVEAERARKSKAGKKGMESRWGQR